MNNQIAENQTKVIELLRFVFLVMVLFVHNQIASEQYPIISFIANWGVPGFFVLSGFLFFYNVNDFTLGVYLNKLRRRIGTLLIPYLFWNTMAALFIFAIALLHFYKDNTDIDLWGQFSPWSLYVNYCQTGAPVHLVMWFVKELILLSILTPLIWCLVKYLRQVVLLIPLFILIYPISICGVSDRAVCYFLIGSYIGIAQKEWIKILMSRWILALCSLIILVYFVVLGFDTLPLFVSRIATLAGVIVCFSIASILVINGFSISRRLSSSSFFIYAIHILQPANGYTIHAFSFAIIGFLLGWVPILGQLLVCILSPFITIVICFGLYKVLAQLSPKLFRIIIGGRI